MDAQGATAEGYCRAAEEKGIDELCFTTHLIIWGPDIDVSIPPEQIGEYIDEIEAAQATTSVKLRIGLEVDYFPQEERRLAKIIDDHSFDLILGSLHYIKGFDIGSKAESRAFFGGRSIGESLDIYYEDWRRAVESGLFDVMAHPDYFRKYLGLTYPEPPAFKEYGSVVLEAIDGLKSCGVGVEVNSSGYRHGLGDCFPSLEFLRAVKRAGIETVTIGSDSHAYAYLGSWLDLAVARLREAGYTRVSTFNDRRPTNIDLKQILRQSSDAKYILQLRAPCKNQI
jgi:histidinol-phosphatase (PHP family)